MAQTSEINTGKTSGKPFPVVGIGASAGGLDAYKRFLKAIPENSGMAFILVQHLDPTHESMLTEILAKQTVLPVHEISDNIPLEADHIYILPPNKLLLATDGVLKLSPRPSKETISRPIDYFFKSLAEVHENQAVGIVLSGTGTDGTLGLKAIKEAAGITFAQDQQSAGYDGMPQSAIDAGVVDFILPPEEMPTQLIQMNLPKHIEEVVLTETAATPPADEEIFNQILALLRIHRQVDFSYYKKSTLRRRIARRIAINKMDDLTAYLNYLKDNKAELDLLFHDVLIPVTAFFRDTATFEAIRNKVFPEIIKGKERNGSLRVWIAACSTGEEAYSIAISLCEILEDNPLGIKIQLFATDISEKAIVAARRGVYTKGQLEGVSDSRLQQFFTKVDNQYQVQKKLRDMIVFAGHNMLKDPPFARLDLITCRNVLIYMEPFLQKKALATFHYSLNEKGFLVLGKSETTGGQADLFKTIDKIEKIYLKKDVTSRFVQPAAERKRPEAKEAVKTLLKVEDIKLDFQKTADQILLQEFTPAGVVINEQLDIVHFRGDTGAYLMPSPGKPNLNLIKMARDGLGFELRSVIHKAKTTNGPATKEGVAIQLNGIDRLVNIKVIPLPKTIDPFYLVLFQESVVLETNKPRQVTGKEMTEVKDMRILQLERELGQAREDMRAITEDQEASNEELQSANEELLSGSEELQSLNEELETTKEELQSGNEELTIVNQELFERNEIITDARKYSDAIIASLHEPLLVLNRDLFIRTANNSFYNTFKVKQKDTEGKLLFELGNNQWDIPALRTLLLSILPGKKEVFDYEVTHIFPVIGERIMLLNAWEIHRESDKEKLILLAIADITERKTAERQLVESLEKNRFLADAVPEKIWTTDDNGVVNYFNQQWVHYTGLSFQELKDWNWEKIIHPDDLAAHQQRWQQSLESGIEFLLEHRFLRHDGQYRWHLSRGLPQKDENGKVIMWVGTITDIHEQKTLAEEKILLEFAEDFASYKTGEEFFSSLVAYLAKKTGMDCVFIGELAEKEINNFSINTIAIRANGNIVPNIEYSLTDGPCEQVIRGTIYSYPKDCLVSFPKNEIIQRFDAEGYAGYPLTDIDGNKIGIVAVMHKKEIPNHEYVSALLKIIGRRAEFEMQRIKFSKILRENNQQLQISNRNLAQYAYVASHDLQEPLRKIMTFAKLVTDRSNDTLNEDSKNYLEKINRSALRMRDLIQDLLAYSSIYETGDKFERTDLNEILQNVTTDFDLLIEEKGALIQNEGLPVVDAVPVQMHQLIQNLVSNALKFSRQGIQPVIHISHKILTTDEAGQHANLNAAFNYSEIIIKDNGMGFSPAYAEQVFVIFQRLNDRQEFPGTGIGLALCRKISEYHGGVIYAQSEEGNGAAFHVILPLERH
ncbi:MAG: PAS domain S-box protein [Chitinophagaceae bacterium]|nr:PAS domain S-box protein [Chitinophagaceae bacterium]